MDVYERNWDGDPMDIFSAKIFLLEDEPPLSNWFIEPIVNLLMICSDPWLRLRERMQLHSYP